MINAPLPRIDLDEELRDLLIKYCRLKNGDIWKDPLGKHKIGCIDVTDKSKLKKMQ